MAIKQITDVYVEGKRMSKNAVALNWSTISPEVFGKMLTNAPDKYKIPVMIGSVTCIVSIEVFELLSELAGAKLAMDNGYNFESARGAKFTKPTAAF